MTTSVEPTTELHRIRVFIEQLVHELEELKNQMRYSGHKTWYRTAKVDAQYLAQEVALHVHAAEEEQIFNPTSGSLTLTLMTMAGQTTLTLPAGVWTEAGFGPDSKILYASGPATIIIREREEA